MSTLTKEQSINRAWQALTLQCEAHGLSDLDSEQVAALSDDSQWPGMLDDMESRLDFDVSEARELLAAHMTADVHGLAFALVGLMGYVGGWDADDSHPCGFARNMLNKYSNARR